MPLPLQAERVQCLQVRVRCLQQQSVHVLGNAFLGQVPAQASNRSGQQKRCIRKRVRRDLLDQINVDLPHTHCMVFTTLKTGIAGRSYTSLSNVGLYCLLPLHSVFDYVLENVAMEEATRGQLVGGDGEVLRLQLHAVFLLPIPAPTFPTAPTTLRLVLHHLGHRHARHRLHLWLRTCTYTDYIIN